jgi:hypothetical protein
VKFKIIFTFFNLVIIVSFLVVFFMPLILLGNDYAALFWKESWYLPLLFLAVVLGIDTYFFFNWKLFRLLEDENWDGVISYLENGLYGKGRCSGQRVRILVNAYLLKNRMEDIERLEKHLKAHRPSLHSRFALSLGVPALLKTDAESLEFFYGALREERRRERDWINFLYSFALLMQGRRDEAREQFSRLVEADYCGPVVMLLSLYTLDPFTREDDDTASLVSRKSAELKKQFQRPALEKSIQRSREQIIPVMLAKLTEDALSWLYPPEREEQA